MKKDGKIDIDSPRIQELKKKALNNSIKEGSAAAYSTGTTFSYATLYALALNATKTQIGILNSLPNLLGPIAQYISSKLMEKYHRKNIVKIFILLQALSYLPLALLGILLYYNLLSSYIVYSFIIFYALVAIFGGFTYSPWFSWMGDLVDEKERGRYFARRNKIIGIFEIAGMLTAVLLLDMFKTVPVLIGFSTLFLLAFISRAFSFYLINKQYIPLEIKRKREKISFSKFLRNNKSFNQFSIYVAFFYFALYLASPFFTVYMKDPTQLNLSYFWIIAITISGAVFTLIFLPLVGKFSDRFGNVKLLIVSNLLFVINPLLWIVVKNPYGLIFIQLVSGLANSAFLIGFNNFSYRSLEQKYRGIGIAYVSILSGIGASASSLIGGILLDYIPPIELNIFFFVFILSAFLRLLIAVIFLPNLKENKSKSTLLSNLAHPLKGLNNEIHTLGSFAHYIEKEETQALKDLKPLKKDVLSK